MALLTKKQIKLADEQIDVLSNAPEQGMGYQVVDVLLNNGAVLERKIVLNAMYLQLDETENITPADIKKIRLHSDK